ncbi:MAG: hypothetical protein KDK70_26505, partial [Myxococcales bacterium]|nr:hypothetical protein [Myxococcales bacterium]
MTGAGLEVDTLRGLAGRPAPEAVGELVALREALPAAGDPERLEALAGAIPRAVGELLPEVCLALCEVAEALVPHRPALLGDVARLEPALRIRWRRVVLAAGTLAAGSLDDEAL